MEKLTKEQIERIETENNVVIDPDTGLYNIDHNAEYGWQEIPAEWV